MEDWRQYIPRGGRIKKYQLYKYSEGTDRPTCRVRSEWFRKLRPTTITFCALEHVISSVCYTLGTKTKMVPSHGKKVFLVGLLCKVALPVACASWLVFAFYGWMTEAWTDKGAARNHVDCKSKVEIQSSNSDHLIEGSKLFFSFISFPFPFFSFPFSSVFWFKAFGFYLVLYGFSNLEDWSLRIILSISVFIHIYVPHSF